MPKVTRYKIEYTQADIHRFEQKLEKTTTCWYFRGALTGKGYGSFFVNEKAILAHRFAFLLYCGPIGAAFVLHSCDHPTCCNPKHLRLGDQQDNIADCVQRNRIAKGKQNGNAKLSDADVEQILFLKILGVKSKEIAKQFNVSRSTILHLHKGETRYGSNRVSIQC